MPNYKVILEYDGNGFSGWQIQKNHHREEVKRTVQGELESVLKLLSGGKTVRVNGAGRTDAGVHARGQVANFIMGKPWEPEELGRAINGNLKEDIYVHTCEIVPDNFHARFSAKARLYRYLCRKGKSVLDRKYVWNLPSYVNLFKVRQCARRIQGEIDFTSFSKSSREQNSRRCIVYESRWIKKGDFISYEIKANRFLHHMIRYLVGTMIEVGKGTLAMEKFCESLEVPDPQAHVYKAPPQGLYLEKVFY